jgi:hypothetical protein
MTTALKEKNQQLHLEAATLSQKVSDLSANDGNSPILFETWQGLSIGDASLNLQSSTSKLAAKLGMPQHLLGPYSDTKTEDFTLFSIEFESETTLEKAAKFLVEIDHMVPMVSVAELDIRPITSFEPDVTDTQVYLRVILQGGYNALSE